MLGYWTFQEQMEEYFKATIDDLETNTKLTNIRDRYFVISDFKKGYQPTATVVKVEKGDLYTDCHSILFAWKKHFPQPFIVHKFKYVRQTDIQPAENSCLRRKSLRLRWLLKSKKDTNHQMLIKPSRSD